MDEIKPTGKGLLWYAQQPGNVVEFSTKLSVEMLKALVEESARIDAMGYVVIKRRQIGKTQAWKAEMAKRYPMTESDAFNPISPNLRGGHQAEVGQSGNEWVKGLGEEGWK